MKETALHSRHIELGAKMINFSGWHMPLSYSSIIDEHNTVRNDVGLFDISHMGKIEILGEDAFNFLQYVLSFDLSRMSTNDTHYALLCYDDGTIVDDAFIFRFPEKYVLIVNAANTDKVIRWLIYHARPFNVHIQNMSESYCLLSLQGPKAERVLQQLTKENLQKLQRHKFIEEHFNNIIMLVSRTGYTGEDGFELLCPESEAQLIWDSILEKGDEFGIKPIGLGARDTLRFECRMPLYGQEIGPNINPYEARLGWAVSLEKSNFIGRENLLKIRLEGITRRLIGFKIDEGGLARKGFDIFSGDGKIGFVTSGTYSPTLRQRLGLGYVTREFAVLDTQLMISIRDALTQATIVKIPFYKINFYKINRS